MTDLTTQFTRPRRTPFSLKVQAMMFVVGAAFLPLVVLLAVASKFFEYGPRSAIPFEYWAFLTVAWVMASALVMAHILAKGLNEQIEPLLQSANVLRRTANMAEPFQGATGGNELEQLASQFARLEAGLADSRSAALGKIADLEAANQQLAASHDLNASFLSAVSHEIRTPLSAIVSSARIIQHYHEKKPEVVGRFGETIATEGKRLVRLVSDLLDLTKMEAKTLDWSDGILRASELTAGTLRRMETQIADRGVSLRVEASESLPRLRGDDKRLGQLLDCLLENAIKFSPENGVVQLSVQERDDYLQFSIRDQGAGISQNDCARIFEKSYAMSSRHAKEWGRHSATLLGLPLCREIVTRHGGRIGATSDLDGGATFYFDLPICRMTYDCDEAGALEENRPVRVLLVMANDVAAEAAQRALRLDDVDVRACSHFQEALSIVQEWVPEVLVVSSNCLWQLSDGIESRLRRHGVGHIMMFSPFEGMVDLSPPTHSAPLLTRIADLVAKGSRILLVEDDEEYASVVDFELSQAGYEVCRACDGVEALAAIEANPPQAMVLDLVLPRLDGFGVLETLVQKKSAIPTIVLTSLDDDRLEERLHNLGAVGVFRKYELIQPRTTEHAARVRKALIPVLGVSPSGSNQRLANRARSA